MSNTLFIGKDLPDGLEFAEALADSGRSVFGIAKSEADAAKFESEKIFIGISCYYDDFYVVIRSKIRKKVNNLNIFIHIFKIFNNYNAVLLYGFKIVADFFFKIIRRKFFQRYFFRQ